MTTIALFWAACMIAAPHRCDPAEVPLAPMIRTVRECNHLAPTMIREKQEDGFRVTMSFCKHTNGEDQ